MSLLEKDTPDVEAGCTVSDLRVALTGRGLDVVDEINIELRPGEVVGLVGESGSGKTTAGTALLAYARRGAFIERGKVMFEGQDVLELSSEQLREIRGMKIAYVPQDPAAALNPAIRIGRQIVELLELHGIGTSEERLDGARAGLREVGLPDDDEFLARYAHQLSGGQVQRVALAMAFLPRPKVLVLDEPTTGLDVTTQDMVLQTLGELCRSHRVAALYVTHDLAVVANIADRVAVMYAGQIIELGPRDAMFRQPAHPYTRALLDAIPHLSRPAPSPASRARRPDPGGARPPAGSTTDASTPRTAAARSSRKMSRSARTTPPSACGSRDRHLGHQPRQHHRHRPAHRAGHHPDDRRPQGLLRPQGGRARRLLRRGQGRGGRAGRRVRQRQDHDLALRRRPAQAVDRGADLRRPPAGQGLPRPLGRGPQAIQYIFQNPYLSLNPRLTIQQIVGRPMELFGIAKGKAARDRVVELLDAVALGPTVLDLQTNRLSGGERQRVAIARALAAEPDLLVCDEITSALDVSVQGSIVALLENLRKTRRISMLFVTHNLALVRSIAARVQVLNAGELVESGFVVEVLDTPKEDYTKRLLASSPAVN